MDRVSYIQIRKQMNLEKQGSALPVFLLQNIFLGLCVWAGWTALSDSLWKYVLVVPMFAMIFRGFGIMHDAVHGAVAKNRLVNDLVGVVGGAFCMLPYETWKQSHLKHHYWSGNVEKDPVMALIILFPKMQQWMQKSISGLWQLWLPILGFLQHTVFWNISMKIYFKEPKSFKVMVSLAVPLLFWGTLFALSSQNFLVSVLLPSLFLYFIGIEVVNLPHHLQLPQFRGEAKFSAWEQYLTARSCVYPKWFARFFVLNFNFHTEHHMFPDVPWYHLDKLQEPVRNALGASYNTDKYFAWIAENKGRPMKNVLEPEERITDKEKEKTAA